MKKEILAIIPARSGSKSLKKKNLLKINKKPLLFYSIRNATNSKIINKVIVSTDSKLIQKISIKYGAECPFLRPKKYATDNAKDFGVIKHCCNWLKKNQNYIPDFIVYLRPTYPSRKTSFVDSVLNKIIKKKLKYDSYRSVVKSPITPYKMWMLKKNKLHPFIGDFKIELFNYPRQKLKQAYWQNGCLDIINYETILNKKTISGTKIYPILMSGEEVLDIDNLDEFNKVKKIIEK